MESTKGTEDSVERQYVLVYRCFKKNLQFFFHQKLSFSFKKKNQLILLLHQSFLGKKMKIKPLLVLLCPQLIFAWNQCKKPGFTKALPKNLTYPRITSIDINRKPKKSFFGLDFLTSTNKILPKINSFGKFKLTTPLYILLRVYTSIPSLKALAVLTFTPVKMFS